MFYRAGRSFRLGLTQSLPRVVGAGSNGGNYAGGGGGEYAPGNFSDTAGAAQYAVTVGAGNLRRFADQRDAGREWRNWRRHGTRRQRRHGRHGR